MSPAFLERWLEEVVATPGATGITDLEDARARPPRRRTARRCLCSRPSRAGRRRGIWRRLARYPARVRAARSARSRCSRPTAASATSSTRFARASRTPASSGGARRSTTLDAYGVALAKALAKPPVAAELCLPLVRQDGVAILWVGEAAEREARCDVLPRPRRAPRGRPRGAARSREARPDAAGIPATAGNGEEASAGLANAAVRCGAAPR